MSIKFLVLGGGILGWGGGGGKCRFYFMGAGIFLKDRLACLEIWSGRPPNFLGVPKPGCFKPGCLQFLRRSALLRSFADLCSRSLALICALLRAFACFCVRQHLEQPRVWELQNYKSEKSWCP